MKGHVGDGARSGGFKAPDTGKQVVTRYMSFVSIRLTSAGIGSLKLDPGGRRTSVRAALVVTQT
jgi:hypothetical protein